MKKGKFTKPVSLGCRWCKLPACIECITIRCDVDNFNESFFIVLQCRL